MIGRRLHAASDYAIPAVIAVLGRSPGRGPGTRRVMGIGPVWHLAYTLLTRHEGGALPVLSMRTHLALDAASALGFVAAGLLMRDERREDRTLLVGLGLAELALVALSDRGPDLREPVPHRPRPRVDAVAGGSTDTVAATEVETPPESLRRLGDSASPPAPPADPDGPSAG